MKPWQTAMNILGYMHDGSYRYEPGADSRILHSRLLSYYSPEHATRGHRYSGTWIVAPPLQHSSQQARLWVTVTRLLSRCTGLHGNHRVSACTDAEGIQAQMYVTPPSHARAYSFPDPIFASARDLGNNILHRNQDGHSRYPHAVRPSFGRILERIGVDCDAGHASLAPGKR